MHDTHTIQVWPSGDGYEYKGAPDAPDDVMNRLRRHNYNGGKPEHWCKGTGDEWRAILAEVRVARYIEVEILKCDSMLVSDLLQTCQDISAYDTTLAKEWTYDNVTGLYQDPSEWDAKQCLKYCDDYGVLLPTIDIGLVADVDIEMWLDELRSMVRDNADAVKVYEWWAVTEWLAGELTAIEEPVLDNAYGCWWGRTCTGQAMKMDGTLQKIARREEATS